MSTARAHALLFTALVLVSTSGPFLVRAHMDAFAMAMWRLLLAAGVWAIVAAATGGLRIPRTAWRHLVPGTALFAAHFALWVKAFDLTDYASNLLLLATQPVVAAVLGARSGEPLTRRTWLSLGLSVGGLALIAGNDLSAGPRALLGDAMAILAGVAITGFYAVTRGESASMPLASFLAVAMGLSGAWLVPLVWVSGSPWLPPSAESWAWLLAIVFVTTAAGHGLMNLVARHVPLFTLNVVIVLEPPIGIALGWLLFGATVTTAQVLGGAVLAAAVWVGLRK